MKNDVITKPDVVYEQALCIFEGGVEILEQTEASFSLLVKQINWDNLTPDQKVAFQGWHKGLQQAVQVIRCPQ